VNYYETPYGKYPKIQILTIADLFDGKQPKIPLVDSAAFKKAPKEIEGGKQDALPFGSSLRSFATRGVWIAFPR
jgi:hypothetical protein